MPKNFKKIIRRSVILGATLSILILSLGGAGPTPQAQAADPCADYDNLERGQGRPEYQHWFNNLDARGYARFRMACMNVYRWGGDQYACLDELWGRLESGWNHTASNPSGAYGIPQALPGWKMGAGWQTDPRVQVRWGLEYIRTNRGNNTDAASPDVGFNTPCEAKTYRLIHGYY